MVLMDFCQGSELKQVRQLSARRFADDIKLSPIPE